LVFNFGTKSSLQSQQNTFLELEKCGQLELGSSHQ